MIQKSRQNQKPRLNSGKETTFKFRKKIKTEELYVFASHLSTLIEAGVPLLTSLSILAQQTENQEFKKVIEKINEDINEGATFTAAISKYSHLFSTLFISMIQAAEKSGKMVHVLKQLSEYLKAQDAFEKKIKSALSYPKFVMSFFMLVLCAIIFGLIPKFKDIFESFDAKLPVPTEILLNISNFAKDNILIELFIIATMVVLFKKYKKRSTVRYYLDKMKLRIPMMGQLILKSLLAKFCKTLSVLLDSGLSLVESIDIASQTSDNVLFTSAIKEVKKGVIEGSTIHHTLQQFPIFPTLMVKMVSIGEASGTLDTMLNKISEIYDGHVDSKIAGLTAIIEPALMVGMGAIVLIVIIALYLPIFNIGGAIH